MAAPTDPLRENEVGTFGELSLRPNPDNLVILPVPPVEDFLPSLRQQIGRDLTQQEIEVQRHKSPSIVVNKSVAERMLAERAARPPVAITEPVVRPPTLTSTYKDMPTESAARMETAIDVFGQHLFSLRNQLVERLRRTIESDELRKGIGKLHRKEYDAVAALAPEEREAALALARKTIDFYMQYVLMLLTGTGDSDRFGDDHAVNYRLVLEVKEVATDEVVEQFDINRKSKKVFYDYYGRWLNRFGSHR
jgi:hypothetical protein